MTSAAKENSDQYEKIPQNYKIEEKPPDVQKYGLGVRHFQIFLIFLILNLSFISRAQLAVTIVAMTDNLEPVVNTQPFKADQEDFHNKSEVIENISEVNLQFNEYKVNVSISDVKENANNTEMHVDSVWNVYRTYNWSKSTQELILNAFNVGYFIMNTPMGMLCQRFGPKISMQIATLGVFFISSVTPWLAAWGGWIAGCISRFLIGVTQAGVVASSQAFLSKWAPIQERSRLVCFSHTGCTLGIVISFQLCGFLCQSKWGWPSTFWTIAIISCTCFIVVTLFMTSDPTENPKVSKEELKYIIGSKKENNNVVKIKRKIPWIAILTSLRIWAIFSAVLGNGFGHFLIFIECPTYMHYILGVNVREAGIFSSLPYIGHVLFSIIFGSLSDFCINRNIIKPRTSRVISGIVAQVGSAMCLLCIPFTTNLTLSLVGFILATSLLSANNTGCNVNILDVSPNFSSTVTALGSTIGNIGVSIVSVLVSKIVTDMTDQTQWRIMFFIVVALSSFCGIFFSSFLSVEQEPWDKNDYELTATDEKDKLNIPTNAYENSTMESKVNIIEKEK